MLGDPKYDAMYKRLGEDSTEIVCLTADSIIDIHDYMIRLHGGSYGLRDDDLFHSVVVAPFQTMFGTDLYPTVFDKAAKYLFDFANYQIFIDGNKRTGYAVCDMFLYKNGFNLTLTPERAYALVMDIANHRYNDSSEIVDILENNFLFCDRAPAGPDPEQTEMYFPMR